MEANEFRLGNLVKCPQGFGQVTQIQDREVLVVDEIGYTMEVIKPIPLTEEWLLKFGIMQSTWFEDSSYMIKEDRGFGWEMYVRNAAKTKKISFAYFKHVHQLQNLYFALTGEELKQ